MENEIVRYVFWGACTTGVNTAIFTFLRYVVKWNLQMSNLCSIAAAVLFAFWVNKYFVFRSDHENWQEICVEFLNFVGARIVTLLIEFAGVGVLARCIGFSDLADKMMIQIVVIVLNYVFSKWIVFQKKDMDGGVCA